MAQDDEQELLAVAPEIDHDASLIAERPEQSGVEEIKGPRLVRSLSLWDAIAMVCGIMVGSGIFASPGDMLCKLSGRPLPFLLLWVLAGCLSLCAALCFAELSAAMPQAGGSYVYLKTAYGPAVGFILVWSMYMVQKAGSQAIIAIVFARYFGSWLSLWEPSPDLDDKWQLKLCAILTIAVLTLINVLNVRFGAIVQKVFTGAKLAAIAIIIVIGVGYVLLGHTATARDNFSAPFAAANGTKDCPSKDSLMFILSSLGSATVSALWAYDGFSDAGFIAEEIVNPGRNLPLALIYGTSGVVVLYVLVNLSYLLVLPIDVVMESEILAMDVGSVVWKPFGRYVIPFFIACSTFGSLNGSIFTGGRLIFAAARDGRFPFSKYTERVNENGSPYVALIAQSCWSCAVILPGGFDTLVQYFGFVSWCFYCLVIVAVIVLRYRQPDLERPFRLAPFPHLPILAATVAVAIVTSSFARQPIASALAAFFVLLSLPAYFFFFAPSPLAARFCPAWFGTTSTTPPEDTLQS